MASTSREVPPRAAVRLSVGDGALSLSLGSEDCLVSGVGLLVDADKSEGCGCCGLGGRGAGECEGPAPVGLGVTVGVLNGLWSLRFVSVSIFVVFASVVVVVVVVVEEVESI